MNLDLKIIPVAKKVILLAESVFGEATLQIDNSFFLEIIERSRTLRDKYDRLTRMYQDDQFRNQVERETKEFGLDLFNSIFRNEILALFHRTVGGSLDGQIDIRLMLGQANLNLIHWEIMRFRDEYLGFRHNLIRHPFIPRPVKSPSNTREKLHILVVSVDPIFGDGTVEEEFEEFMGIFSPFAKQDKIRLSSLYQKDATLDNIKDILFEGVDIWHFTGHGIFDVDNPQESSLIVWPEGKRKGLRDYDQLSIRLLNTLAMNNNLGFCFLNACDTGKGAEVEQEEGRESLTSRDSFVSMAHSLIKTGVPMVIATNHQITTEAAKLLSKRFYRSIVKYGKPVDQALREARAELFVEAGKKVLFSDWSCPVLYARSRLMEIGTEQLKWQPSFDIYSIRNVKRPAIEVAMADKRGTQENR